jgi:hypothetical protein
VILGVLARGEAGESVCAGLCGDDMLKNGVCAAK